MPYQVPKIVSAAEAVRCIQNGMTLAINTMSSTGYPLALSRALCDQFQNTGEPRNIEFWGSTAQSMHALNDYTESLARCDGMFRKVIMGHWVTVPTFVKHAAENKFAAYNFPQGIVSHLYRAAAGRNPVVISEVGLETFADPRHGGGKLNEMATEDYVTIVNIDGREFLQYKTPKIDVCFIRGTTADPMGNITSEKEAAYIDALTLAMATRANGGVVIAQVERLSERKAHCKKILVPGLVVDYIVVDSHQEQTYKEVYHPAYSGETVLSANLIPDQLKSVFEKGGGLFAQRGIEHYAVARRAAEEIKPGYVVNIGIGMAGLGTDNRGGKRPAGPDFHDQRGRYHRWHSIACGPFWRIFESHVYDGHAHHVRFL